MAEKKIRLLYNLCQNNVKNSPANGKWYPRAVRFNTLDLDGLCDHIAGHGSIYTNDVVKGVLLKFVGCMTELISEGIGVKLDGLGTFYPTLESEGAESAIGYDINANIKGVHIRFLPDDSDRAALTSRKFREKVTLKQNMIFDKFGVPKKVVNNQLVDYGDEDEEEGGEG